MNMSLWCSPEVWHVFIVLLFYNFSTDCSPLNNKNLIYASKHLEHLEQTWTSLNVTYCNNQFVLKSVTFCTLSPSDLCLCLFFSSNTDNCFLMEPKDSYQMQSKLCLATIVAKFDCAKTTNTVNRVMTQTGVVNVPAHTTLSLIFAVVRESWSSWVLLYRTSWWGITEI